MGLSTPLTPDTLPAHVKTDEEIATYLKHFRQDNIGEARVSRYNLLFLSRQET